MVRSNKIVFQTTYLDEIDSTNRFLADKIKSGNITHDYEVVWTKYQTQGRGRLNRGWVAPKGSSVLASFGLILKASSIAVSKGYLLSCALSLSALSAIKKLFNLNLSLKWPNDLIIKKELALHLGFNCSTDLKLAGVLTELATGNEREVLRNNLKKQVLSWAVVGIGINVNWPAKEKLTNLLDEQTLKRLGSINYFTETHTNSVDDLFYELKLQAEENFSLINDSTGCNYLLERYRQNLATLGEFVKVQTITGETFLGKAVGLTQDGELLIESKDQIIKITEGDIWHVR
jgi:BirA family biotin operon repressor/biotin-[acetyl-CoA-carboxylase] ligase